MIHKEDVTGKYSKIISNHDFKEEGLIAVNMQSNLFKDCMFTGMMIYKADMTNCKMQNCVFDKVQFINPVSTQDLIFENCKFVNCDFIDANLYDIKIRNCSFITKVVSNDPNN